MPSLDLERQLVFYGAYHHNKVNIWIHIICVPMILATALTLGTNTPALLDLPYLPLNLGTIAAFVYIILYLLMEPVAGGLYAPLIIGSAIYGNYLTKEYGWEANRIAIGIHAVSWIAQFVGHGKFEGRAPALLDNLFQAVFLAPFFVWFELLFALGYRPELQTRVENGVVREVAKFRAAKRAKANGGSVEVDRLSANGKANGKAA